MRVIRRPAAAVAVLLLATSLLTACRTNVGTAARVGGERISENRVNSFVAPNGASSAAVADAAANGNTLLPPKTIAVEILAREVLFERALRLSKGGVPTVGALNAVIDKGVGVVFGVSETDASAARKQLTQQLVAVGLTTSFPAHFFRWAAMVYYYGNRIQAASRADAYAQALKVGGPVSISPRYGQWVPASLEVSVNDGAGAPDFLTVRPTAAAAP